MLVGASCQAAFIGSGQGTWGIGVLELFGGVCVTGAFALWETSPGEHIPSHALSRVASYDYLSSSGTIPLGNLLAGAASAAYGIHETLIGMTIVGIGCSLAVASLPSLRNLPRGAEVLPAHTD